MPRIKVGPNPNHDIWRCRTCHAVNAWNWEDAERAEKILGEEVFHATGSAFDNICGKCRTDYVRRDSPIRANCYTHKEE